ncbi:acid protease [Boletus reticuloceps]|uniref:Acid protease n=1 Tax=Boletus reticuloceps TaxID=495285 RepID=A0A8I2YP61_9AGAM|nr:acid protease [Boletus reticuloceps]
MKSFVALSVILLATSASSSTTIPLTKLRGTGAYLKVSPDAGRARAALLKLRTDYEPTTVPATYLGYGSYVTKVGIGKPPTYYNLIIDTGSSNTFCGAGTPYVQTSTSIPTGEAVDVTYGSGGFTGNEYLDQVTLAPNLVIVNQSIGDALSFAGFGIANGILGLGPRDLTLRTLLPDTNVTIPTVMNSLVSQGLIEDQVLGVYFAPPTSDNDTNGALTYGGTDSSLYEGNLTWVPVTKTYPASRFWGVNVTLCTYGNQTVIPTSTAGVVDTGTTQVLLADDFFTVYMNAIPGANKDSNTGLLDIPPSSISYMQPLNFTLADRVFSMDVAAQLVPADQNTAWGGVPGKRYGTVGHLSSNSGQGLDFLLGIKFLERYYSAFDAHGKRVGFAQTKAGPWAVIEGSGFNFAEPEPSKAEAEPGPHITVVVVDSQHDSHDGDSRRHLWITSPSPQAQQYTIHPSQR